MKRAAEIYRNGRLAGVLEEAADDLFCFTYNADYLADPNEAPISLTLPKNEREHTSPFLFPFFFNMISEGANRDLQCRRLKIDPRDHFGLLLATTQFDNIGAITLKPIPVA